MVSPTLVKVTRYNPGQLGDNETPFVGRAGFKPSIERHIEGETPPDYIVTTRKFFVSFGEALMDGDTEIKPATPGVAWVYLEPTDYGPYADAWAWVIDFYAPGQATECGDGGGSYLVPTVPDGTVVDFADLVEVDPDAAPEPPPAWVIDLANEVAARIAGDSILQTAIDDEEADRIAGDAALQTQIDAITGGGLVTSVNSLVGDIVIQMVEFPAGSNLWVLDVSNAGPQPDPAWLVAADELSDRIDVLEELPTPVFTSTDGSFGLATPTGTGGELVVTADALDDIRYDGVDL